MTFSTPGLHSLTYADDFWNDARELRRELLNAALWKPTTQYDATGFSAIETERQNGLTLTDLREVPHTHALRAHLHEHRRELCALVGLDAATAETAGVEMNGMAYGEGCWLAPHTDFVPTNAGRRLAAWMLYLTHPDDGEWSGEDGGAVCLRQHRREERLSPRFNRFAMFAVSPSSVHEIERVNRGGGFDRCRLALSGWFHGPNPVRHEARLFTRRESTRTACATAASEAGDAALRRLWRSQREYIGVDSSTVDSDLAALREGLASQHADAPPGTVFTGYVPGPAACIFVVDEHGKLLFFGPREQYQ